MKELMELLKNLPLVALGILLSILIPILRAKLPGSRAQVSQASYIQYVRPYLIIAIFSLLTSIVILAFLGDSVQTIKWNGLLLAGYAWDSTLQKVTEVN